MMHNGPFIFWPIWCVLHLTKWSAINVKHIIELVNVIDELFVINMDILACDNYIWTQRCSFCNLPQSHHRSKMFTANFSGRHRCLGFRDSSTMKIVLCRSNSITCIELAFFFFDLNDLVNIFCQFFTWCHHCYGFSTPFDKVSVASKYYWPMQRLWDSLFFLTLNS